MSVKQSKSKLKIMEENKKYSQVRLRFSSYFY